MIKNNKGGIISTFLLVLVAALIIFAIYLYLDQSDYGQCLKDVAEDYCESTEQKYVTHMVFFFQCEKPDSGRDFLTSDSHMYHFTSEEKDGCKK